MSRGAIPSIHTPQIRRNLFILEPGKFLLKIQDSNSDQIMHKKA